jgi:hypothetical protein
MARGSDGEAELAFGWALQTFALLTLSIKIAVQWFCALPPNNALLWGEGELGRMLVAS